MCVCVCVCVCAGAFVRVCLQSLFLSVCISMKRKERQAGSVGEATVEQ